MLLIELLQGKNNFYKFKEETNILTFKTQSPFRNNFILNDFKLIH